MKSVFAACVLTAALIAFPALAQKLFTVPPGTYSGTMDIPATNIPQGATVLVATLDITSATDPATGFNGTFDISYDNGQSWQFWSSATFIGGVYRDRNGVQITVWRNGGGLEQPSNAQRKVRGSIVITGTVPLGGGTVEVF
jgi:opacity protein-like surface antigen